MGTANFKMLYSARGRLITPGEDGVRLSHQRRQDDGTRVSSELNWGRLGESWSSWVGRTSYGDKGMDDGPMWESERKGRVRK